MLDLLKEFEVYLTGFIWIFQSGVYQWPVSLISAILDKGSAKFTICLITGIGMLPIKCNLELISTIPDSRFTEPLLESFENIPVSSKLSVCKIFLSKRKIPSSVLKFNEPNGRGIGKRLNFSDNIPKKWISFRFLS